MTKVLACKTLIDYRVDDTYKIAIKNLTGVDVLWEGSFSQFAKDILFDDKVLCKIYGIRTQPEIRIVEIFVEKYSKGDVKYETG